MKVTAKPHSTTPFQGTVLSAKTLAQNPDTDLNPTLKPRRKLVRNQTRLKKASGGKSRPGTPFLRWKVEERESDDDVEERESGRREGRRRRKREKVVSVRKIAAGLWRLQLPESGGERRREKVIHQPGASHVGIPFLPHHGSKTHCSEPMDPLHSPSSVSGAKNKLLCKLEPSFQFSNSAMEGATKWDPVCLETLEEVRQMYSYMKRLDQQVSAVSVVSALETELEQAKSRIQELENERRSSKKKLEHFLKKVSEERAAWRSREHEKIRAFVDDIKSDLNRERKSRQRLEIVNSKLVNELADAKVTAKRYMQDYEKERKARELVEEVCEELAKEIGEDKAEVEELKKESMRIREEVDEERKMLQMAEVWREERVQMKLVDAKVALEEKYSHMNKLVAELENFLRSRVAAPDLKEMKEAESLVQAAASVQVQEIKEFTYEPPNPGDIFSVFEEVAFSEAHEREIQQCVDYSPASHASKIHTVSPEGNIIAMDHNHRHSDAYDDHSGEIDEDESGWETVSHLEDQGSSYSPEESPPSVTKNHRDSNVSGSGTDWEEHVHDGTGITEIRELCSVPTKHLKKVSSIARLWKSGPNNGVNYKIISVDEMNGRISNGRKPNGGIMSPDQGSGEGGLSPPDLMGDWSSTDSGNPHISRGMKGCIEWPRGVQKNSLKARLMEARMGSQKVQLRHVLKQKI